MRALACGPPGTPLQLKRRPVPQPGDGQLLIRVIACGVCRTDLHVVDGELPRARPGVVPGHEIVGEVAAAGSGPACERWPVGSRVGVPWLGDTCGRCRYCCDGRENLCEQARFTGCDLDGGYADYVLADAAYCLPVPDSYSAAAAAPLLCAGLIGYRSLRLAGDPARLGLYGFGAAAHIVAQLAVAEGREVYAFTRPDDVAAQRLARSLGACWADSSELMPPEELDAAIVFAPVGPLVPLALTRLARGGTVVCAGIHMSDIPSFPYRDLWNERVIRSVANLTRRDGEEFMALAARLPIHTEVHEFPLEQADEALGGLRCGAFAGAAVLRP
ncbi:MAG: zinc-dependent alcohol dehydrogenase family protein [Sinobacteraceae bacterium]|nr:zinc-dependent alcohol dehydrogenase family protein [Nevskiaceae bacterium]MCP5359525.1 zinc-dependent alcohol dehydrogenase family protein [Nevskiaceae bacterium]MCP5467473.1 zinc-dependent alcohol dehydrogenase family protein [Nevskiaceae bacterium]